MGYYDDDGDRRWIATAGLILLVALLAVGGFWLFTSGKETSSTVDVVLTTVERTATSLPGTATTAAEVASEAPVPAGDVSTTDDGRAPSTSRGTVTTTTGSGGSPTTTAGSTPASGSTVASAATTSTAAGGAAPSITVVPDLGYPTAPDGSPLPIVAIFDTDTISITGYVPSEAARERLTALAIANSQTPATVVDNMIVNDKVPLNVGVRVIELNSVRFPDASAQILPEHALELDRVVTIMNALPNITVLVIGHADQRGTDAANFEISDERARAVVNYLRFLGISPTRISSRAAGATDLLTLNDDDTALALNRRTEFVFSGLLLP